MTIDFHCHLFKSSEDLKGIQSLTAFFAERLKILGKATTPEKIEQELYPSWTDPDGQKTVALMDEAGIAKTVLLVAGLGLDQGNVQEILVRRNGEMATIAANHPHRLIPFCALHPRLPRVKEFLVRCVTEWGAKGIKLDPLSGDFYPHENRMYPIYEKACELGLPIVMHTGPRPGDPRAQNGHPSWLNQPLADFPEMRIVAAHMSFSWWRDLIKVGGERLNLMCDISAYQLTAAVNYGLFCHLLRKVMDGFGAHRVLFGTDGPVFDIFIARDQWVRQIESLPAYSTESDRFTTEEIEALLQHNAERLLTGAPAGGSAKSAGGKANGGE